MSDLHGRISATWDLTQERILKIGSTILKPRLSHSLIGARFRFIVNLGMSKIERLVIMMLLKNGIDYRYLRWIIQPDRIELIVFMRNGEQVKVWIRPEEDPASVMQRLQGRLRAHYYI